MIQIIRGGGINDFIFEASSRAGIVVNNERMTGFGFRFVLYVI